MGSIYQNRRAASQNRRAARTGGGGRSFRRGGAGALLLTATALTLAMGAPVLVDPEVRLFGSEMVGRAHDPFTVVHRFENPVWPRVRSQPATDYAGALLAALTGSGVVAYNLLALATFPLAALFAFLLARHLTGSAIAAWVAGLFYAFAPFHVAHAAYHPHIVQTQWLPLYLLTLWLCLERATAGRLAALLAAAALVALSNFYAGLTAAVVTPVAILGYWWFESRGRSPGATRELAVTAGVLAATGLAGLGYVLLQAPAVFADPASLAFPREDLFRYTARWYSYLLPPVEHPVLGGWVASIWERLEIRGALLEQQVTVGAGLLVLAGAAVAGRARHGGGRLRRSVPTLLLLGGAAFLCSLSPEWRVAGIGIPRPSALLYELLPMFRAHARFGLVVILCVALLAGIGVAGLLRSGSRAARAAALVLLAAGAFELAPFPPWRWRDVLPTRAHRWLAETGTERGSVRVLDCVPASDPAQTSARRFFPHTLRFLGRTEDCGEPGLAGELAARGTTHLIARAGSSAERWLSGPGASPGLRPLRTFEDATLYAVEAEPSAVGLGIVAGFHWREYKERTTYRWMGERGRLELVNRLERPVTVRLELVLHAFPAPRRLAAELDGVPVAAWTVGTEPAPRVLGPLELAPGRHALLLEPASPPTVPDELLGSGDRRPLSVALGDWTIAVCTLRRQQQDHPGGEQQDDELEGDAGLEEVAEAVAAGSEDQGVDR